MDEALRQALAEQALQVQQAGPQLRSQTRLALHRRQTQSEQAGVLISGVLGPAFMQSLHGRWLQGEVVALAEQLALAMQSEEVSVRLECLSWTPCPRWHADHVKARLLCTLLGPGTLYIPNRCACSPTCAPAWGPPVPCPGPDPV